MIAQLGEMYVIQNLKEKCGDIRKSGCPTCAAGGLSTTVAPMNPILSFAPGERLVVDMKQMPVQDATNERRSRGSNVLEGSPGPSGILVSRPDVAH